MEEAGGAAGRAARRSASRTRAATLLRMAPLRADQQLDVHRPRLGRAQRDVETHQPVIFEMFGIPARNVASRRPLLAVDIDEDRLPGSGPAGDRDRVGASDNASLRRHIPLVTARSPGCGKRGRGDADRAHAARAPSRRGPQRLVTAILAVPATSRRTTWRALRRRYCRRCRCRTAARVSTLSGAGRDR